MDSAFGLVGKDYVIVVTDCSVVYSILKLKVINLQGMQTYCCDFTKNI